MPKNCWHASKKLMNEEAEGGGGEERAKAEAPRAKNVICTATGHSLRVWRIKV